MSDMSGRIKILIQDESYRQRPYLDCCGKYWRDCSCEKKGKLTGAIGRNFDDVGISLAESIVLAENDLSKAEAQADGVFPWFKSLSPTRKDVVVFMIFNMGMDGFLEFKNMIHAIEAGNFELAAVEMLSSKWAGQVGDRARRLATMMKDGN